jgi:hypothetical protein
MPLEHLESLENDPLAAVNCCTWPQLLSSSDVGEFLDSQEFESSINTQNAGNSKMASTALSLPAQAMLQAGNTSCPTSNPVVLSPHTMAIQSDYAHSFQVIKSDSTLIMWHCNLCHSGPFSIIFDCRYWKLHSCHPCMQGA